MTDIARERRLLTDQGLDIIRRESWGARQDYTSARRVDEPALWFFLHISVTNDPADTPAAEAAACRDVEAIGQQRFQIGCSYNAGTMQSGRLYEMQPLTRRGAHTVNDKDVPGFPQGSLNYGGRACVLVQNVEDAVTDAQIDSAARWAAAQRRSGLAVLFARWYGHRDFAYKSCPGDIAYARLGELQQLTDQYTRVGLGPTTPEDDLPYTPEQLTKIVRDSVKAEFSTKPAEESTRTAVIGLMRRATELNCWSLAVPENFQQGGDVFYVHGKAEKIRFKQGSKLHEKIKADLAADGQSTAAEVIEQAVLDEIPDA